MPRVELTDLYLDYAKDLGRRIVGQLSVIAGTRSTGTARVIATGDPVQLPPNSYAMPVQADLARSNYLVKVVHNPETATSHLTGGDWTITSGGVDVPFTMNVGGPHVIPAGAVLRFDPPVAGIEPTATVISPGIRGGSATPSLANRIVFYDELEASKELEFFRASGGSFPAVIVGWVRSSPIEGRAGGSPGRTKAGRGRSMYFEEFVAISVSGNLTATDVRWDEAQKLARAITELLRDRSRSDDGETLSTGRGIEILSVGRYAKGKQSQAFSVTFRTRSAWARRDARSFAPWLRTRYRGFSPETEANTEELVVHDFVDPMPTEG